jgi:hypothetical protein
MEGQVIWVGAMRCVALRREYATKYRRAMRIAQQFGIALLQAAGQNAALTWDASCCRDMDG